MKNKTMMFLVWCFLRFSTLFYGISIVIFFGFSGWISFLAAALIFFITLIVTNSRYQYFSGKSFSECMNELKQEELFEKLYEAEKSGDKEKILQRRSAIQWERWIAFKNFNQKNRIDLIEKSSGDISKPCYKLNFCPYGDLVYYFYYKQDIYNSNPQENCKLWEVICPVFYLGDKDISNECQKERTDKTLGGVLDLDSL